MGRSGAARALDGGIAGLRAGYRSGLSPIEVVDEVLDRISRDDDPAIWIDVEPADVLRSAAEALVAGGGDPLPLWGMPFGVKDNIDVAGRVTTAALPGRARRAARSATVVARLVAAGAIYVGKTNLDQLATGLVGTRSPYGTPRNPLDPLVIPGGSSSGSAVAVARRQVAFALGTDTAGSGRVPAALCGVVGLKGAPGTRPLDGVLPASPTIDCVSTFATTIADGLEVEGVLAGRPWPVATGPVRIGASDPDRPELAALRARGDAVSPVDLRPFREVGDLLYGGALLAERTAVLGPMLADDPAGFDAVVRRVVQRGAAYRGTEVFDAQRRLQALRADLAHTWNEVDVLVVQTVEWVPGLNEVQADPIGTNERLGRNTSFANLLGLAAIAVPAATGPGGVTVLAPPSRMGAIAAVAGRLRRESLAVSGADQEGRHQLAVVGAHLTGQPLNHELTERGAELVERTTTSARYRLYCLGGGPPARPGLERVGNGGVEMPVEVWSLDDAALGALTAGVARPLGIGSVELTGGRWVRGFICEPYGLAEATDITGHGGWRAYLEDRDRAALPPSMGDR
ncbi:MAG: amidase family protein [Microthrixaceae bacterium]